MDTVSTVTGRPLRADAERNRQRILDAAADLFAAEGLDVTLDDVARQAGVGVGTVYRRFANKQELVDALFERTLEEMETKARECLADPDPWHALVTFLEYSCLTMAVNRGLGDVITDRMTDLQRISCTRERITPVIEQILVRARDAGTLRAEAEVSDFFALIRMIEAIADFARPVNAEVWRRYLAVMLDGLRSDDLPRCPLPVPALTEDQIMQAKQHCAGRRR
ncbi:TetR/AcrR family transcriptional regulator [Speluncibacter jeojiensis]|uniref:TetR/AcrR family transcriptional regulator n=1 Tax=Speluncibacter jeojiensis TaxID=2710754 RepID=A0A9X4LXF0_9ACTN|nr:TetR/AcrR family transcriptional regulator [Corynebacteriales bacterium D3-21]